VGHTFLQVGPNDYDKQNQMVMTSGTSQLTSGTRQYDKWDQMVMTSGAHIFMTSGTHSCCHTVPYFGDGFIIFVIVYKCKFHTNFDSNFQI
jgi:hypothetical protein